MARTQLQAGAATADVTPAPSVFLYGYPHARRHSTGMHDPLLSSALYLSDGTAQMIFVANDIISIPKPLAAQARARIESDTAVPAANIMVTATHTHSGPMTVDYVCSEADPVVPKTDPVYLRQIEDGIVSAACQAVAAAHKAEIALPSAHCEGLGTHRHDPQGPRDPAVPILAVRDASSRQFIALMLVCSMHPTVLHEDSTLISGDFPGMARQQLQRTLVDASVPVLCHTGAAGNQSPRHVTRGNTFEEAIRLGGLLADSVSRSLRGAFYEPTASVAAQRQFIELEPRQFPSIEEAARWLEEAKARLTQLRRDKAPTQEVRTAECDWFGAEETLTLARAAAQGRLNDVRQQLMPAEVQVFSVGTRRYVGWPGEIFVEFSLQVRSAVPDAYVISLANGELQGYIVTPQAHAEGWYEASNSLFGLLSGQMLVDKTIEMLSGGKAARGA